MSNSKYYDGTKFVELGKDDLTTITTESIGAQPANPLIKNIHVSTIEPTALDGDDGDLWLIYE